MKNKTKFCEIYATQRLGYCLMEKIRNVSYKDQKQTFPDVLQSRRSQKFHKFNRKTTVLESLFNKVAGLKV